MRNTDSGPGLSKLRLAGTTRAVTKRHTSGALPERRRFGPNDLSVERLQGQQFPLDRLDAHPDAAVEGFGVEFEVRVVGIRGGRVGPEEFWGSSGVAHF